LALELEGGTKANGAEKVQEILNGQNLDVIEVSTDQLSISVDSIRKLVQESEMNPVDMPLKVIILKQANLITEQAANALLKSIEEPAPNTAWILCATDESTILPTIRSRSSKVYFEHFPKDKIIQTLKEETHKSDEQIEKILQFTEDLDDALFFAKNEEELGMQKKIVDHAKKVSSIYDAFTLAKYIYEVFSKNPDKRLVKESIIRHLKGLIVVYVNEFKESAQMRADDRTAVKIDSIRLAIMRIRKNLSVQLALETLFISFCK
jgi:hypothetical protein